MMADEKIKNSNELEFAVFCIENVAEKLGVDAERVYQAFTKKSDILNGYIVPEYEVLHTQSREYIVDDLLDVMKERGLEITPLNGNIQSKKSSAMTANPILLQKKYARVIECFAKQQGLSLDATSTHSSVLSGFWIYSKAFFRCDAGFLPSDSMIFRIFVIAILPAPPRMFSLHHPDCSAVCQYRCNITFPVNWQALLPD